VDCPQSAGSVLINVIVLSVNVNVPEYELLLPVWYSYVNIKLKPEKVYVITPKLGPLVTTCFHVPSKSASLVGMVAQDTNTKPEASIPSSAAKNSFFIKTLNTA
jgi:hypothetical protein